MFRKMRYLATGISVMVLVSPAIAGENDTTDQVTIEQASQYLHYAGGNDRVRVEIAPKYSEELGFSLKGAVGSYLTDEIALGLIVEYGENKREYLANAGIQLTDALSFVGTVGMLEEHVRFYEGENREVVQQMEYGASLKGDFEIGLLGGFELNGYLAEADTDYEFAEVGKLYGVQLLADFDLTDTTHIKLGGGYEWLEWDDTNDDESSWTFSAEAAQQLGDKLSLTGNAKLGASEYVYGGGLAFDLSNGGPNTNTIGVNYTYIDGKNGIEDDQRVELSWSMGFGAGPSTSVAAADLTDKTGTIRAAADVAMVSPANNLLNDVMKRPAFLPERVLARGVESETSSLDCYESFLTDPLSVEVERVGVWYVDSGAEDERDDDGFITNPNLSDDSIDIDSESRLGFGKFDLYLSQDPSEPFELSELKEGANLDPGVNDSVVPVTPEPLNYEDGRYVYNESIWAFIDDNGVCKAIFWEED